MPSVAWTGQLWWAIREWNQPIEAGVPVGDYGLQLTRDHLTKSISNPESDLHEPETAGTMLA